MSLEINFFVYDALKKRRKQERKRKRENEKKRKKQEQKRDKWRATEDQVVCKYDGQEGAARENRRKTQRH